MRLHTARTAKQPRIRTDCSRSKTGINFPHCLDVSCSDSNAPVDCQLYNAQHLHQSQQCLCHNFHDSNGPPCCHRTIFLHIHPPSNWITRDYISQSVSRGNYFSCLVTRHQWPGNCVVPLPTRNCAHHSFLAINLSLAAQPALLNIGPRVHKAHDCLALYMGNLFPALCSPIFH
jgi:hypothetical protein